MTVPEAAVCWDVAGVQRATTVYVQSRVLTEFLTAVRVWTGGWEERLPAGA